ncbi:MAG: hypothetical protein ACK44D_08295 [Bacteroidia bacterium]
MTKKLKYMFGSISYALVLIIFVACGSGQNTKDVTLNDTSEVVPEYPQSMADSTAAIAPDDVTAEEMPPLVGSPAPEVEVKDSITVFPPNDSTPEEAPPTTGSRTPEIKKDVATLCYSYFTRIAVNETKDVNVIVSMDNDAENLLHQIQDIVEEQEHQVIEEIKHDSQNCIRIKPYKKLTIELNDLDGCFEIYCKDSQTQEMDTLHNISWRWTIKPKSEIDRESARLVVRISGEEHGGRIRKIREKDIKLDIIIPPDSFCRKMVSFLYNNPESLLTLLLIPIFKYLFGLIKTKKDNE